MGNLRWKRFVANSLIACFKPTDFRKLVIMGLVQPL